MSVDALIRRTHDAGLALRLVDGQLKLIGKRSAVAAWLPKIRPYRDSLIEALQPPSPEISTVDWCRLDRAYQAHHWRCPTCCAAGKGYGLRCGTGSALWSAYSNTATGIRHDRTE